MNPLKTLLKDFFRSDTAPSLTDSSSLHEIAVLYPNVYEFIERKYGIKAEASDRTLALKLFVDKFGLPPAPVVFMEIQLDARDSKINEIPAKELKAEILYGNPPTLLDAREEWERKVANIEGAIPLTATLLDEALNHWDKTQRIVVFCHHGVRSADAAIFLADRGFKNVAILKGGIDAWSTDVDPKVPRYEGAYC